MRLEYHNPKSLAMRQYFHTKNTTLSIFSGYFLPQRLFYFLRLILEGLEKYPLKQG